MSSILAQARDRDLNAEDAPYYFNSAHWRAIDGALQGVAARLGLIVISGPTGSGKSTVMRAVTQQAGESIRFLTLPYANLGVIEFVNFIEKGFDAAKGAPDARSNAEAVKRFTLQRAEAGESLAILIDEAQNLSDEVLENLPRLLRFASDSRGRPIGLQFILIGGEELTRKLSEPRFDGARSAVGAHFQLRHFTRSEMEAFLKRRLAPIARMTSEPITAEGVDALALYTAGNPRLLGMVCAHAMLFAAETPGRSIDRAMVEEAARALMLEPKPEGPPVDDEAHGEPLLHAAPRIELNFGDGGDDEELEQDDDEDPDVWNEGDRALSRNRRQSVSGQIGAKVKGLVGKREVFEDGRKKTAPSNGAGRKGGVRRPRTRSRGRGRDLMRWGLRLGAAAAALALLIGLSGPAGRAYDAVSGSIVAWLDPPPGPTRIGLDPLNPSTEAQAPRQGIVQAVKGALLQGVDTAQLWLFGAVDDPIIEAFNLPLGEMRKILTLSLVDSDPLTASAAYALDGERFFAMSQYIEPRKENAYDAYRRALALDETNEVARRGVERLAGIYEGLAEKARAERDWSTANLLYERSVAMRDLAPIR
ncbi:AAA family ATPase [Neomegalonema sp.]|uniref:ExeA family protein n=1 Tax=Neomegalonema sp. TaxID=2039713 RepID=UPI00261752D8|nr:AAA family ATPase [Neomegalonema sp.]MDD2869525.1 AAA family ATPase [Neomegalonema sp.]